MKHLAGKTIAGPVDVVLRAMFGLPQQDSHVMLYHFITFHYGDVAGWKQVRGK